jgi:hypothetical protein
MTDQTPAKPVVIVGDTNTRDRSYWLSHPDVVSASSVIRQKDGGEPIYDLMLILQAPPAESDLPKPPTIYDGAKAPAREPDRTLFVEGPPNNAFISRLPNLEFMEAFQEGMPHEDAPNGWWYLRLWIRAGV